MENWLASKGTTQQFTAPYTSAHIGRVERMHRTLMAKARTMRIYAGLPANLWDEFYLTATHLHAKTTTKSLSGKTPWELWYGRIPDYSYMREIGCRAFVLIQNKMNPKIYERSIECILIGYDGKSKTYWCYDPKTRQIYSSYHVRFLESHDGHSRNTTIDLSNNDGNQFTQTTPSSIVYHPDQVADTPPDPIPYLSQQEQTSQQQPIEVQPDDPPIPRRSNRTTAGQPASTIRLEHAIQSSKESAERLRLQKQERLHAIAELHNTATSSEPTDLNRDELQVALSLIQFDSALSNNENLDDIPHTLGVDPLTCNDEPQTWDEALRSGDASHWRNGFQEELDSLKAMGVYKLLPRSEVPVGCKIRKGKPVFRIKRDESGKAVRWKVWLVFKGFEQIYGKDYHKTTSPTARMESWHILLHIAATLDWDAQQIDIKTVFLYGLLPEDEVQYMEQPEGFIQLGKENYVWMLLRGLYGMKQSGRIWNKTMNEQMLSWGFTRLTSEACIYYRRTTTGIVITAVHVDDFLSIASTAAENEAFKNQMRQIWTISDLGSARFVVGIAITRNHLHHSIYLSQTALIDRIIRQFGQTNSSTVSTPMEHSLKL
jgi:hypothetical protein